MKANLFKATLSSGLAVGAVLLTLILVGIARQPAQAQPQPPPPADAQNPIMEPQQPAEVLPPDIQSNAALAEIIRLSQAAVSEDVITNFVNNAQYKFNLTANQIIYLKDIGVPDGVVMTMIQHDQRFGATVATPSPQAVPAPPPTTTVVVSDDYFYDSLAPYGTWVYVEGYGRCWRPSVVVYDRAWRPYCDHGHWVYTDCGWYWYSDYSWGWAPFHYGRWFFDGRFGWCWWPDTVWGPSWVTWRYSSDYCGWAPLPPHCYYRPGVGLVYNGITVSVGFDFGFGVGAFTFVNTRNFCDPHPWRYRVPATQVTQVYNNTTINNITVVNNGNNNNTTVAVNNGGGNTTVINNGIPPEHIAGVTHTPVHPIHIRETSDPVGRGEQIDRSGTLVVNRPHFNRNRQGNDNNNTTIGDNGSHTIPSPTTGTPMQVPPPGQNENRNSPRRNPPGQANDNANPLPGGNGNPNNNDNHRNVPNRSQALPTAPQSPTVTPQAPPNRNDNENNRRDRNEPNRFGTTLPQVPDTAPTPTATESQSNNHPGRPAPGQSRNLPAGAAIQPQPDNGNNRDWSNPNRQNVPPQAVPQQPQPAPTPAPQENRGQARQNDVTPAPEDNRRSWQQPPPQAQPQPQPTRNYPTPQPRPNYPAAQPQPQPQPPVQPQPSQPDQSQRPQRDRDKDKDR